MTSIRTANEPASSRWWRHRRATLALSATLSILGGATAAFGAAPNPVATLVLANQVAAYGRLHHDAMSLVVAATMVRDIGLGPSMRAGRTAGVNAGVNAGGSAGSSAGPGAGGTAAASAVTSGGKPIAAVPDDGSPATAWLALALQYAGDRADLKGLVEDARADRARGAVDPIESAPLSLGPRESRVMRVGFEGGSDAAAGVVLPAAAAADDDTDVDLYVTDERGASICSSEGPGVPELCRWTPRRGGKFQIRIDNRKNTPAQLLLVIR